MNCCLCRYLILYYNKFFLNSQENAFHHADFFFYCDLYLKQYSVLKIYNQNTHYDFHTSNNNLSQTKSNEEAAAASYDVPLCIAIALVFRHKITGLAQIFIHSNYLLQIRGAIQDCLIIISASMSLGTLIASFSITIGTRTMVFVF